MVEQFSAQAQHARFNTSCWVWFSVPCCIKNCGYTVKGLQWLHTVLVLFLSHFLCVLVKVSFDFPISNRVPSITCEVCYTFAWGRGGDITLF